MNLLSGLVASPKLRPQDAYPSHTAGEPMKKILAGFHLGNTLDSSLMRDRDEKKWRKCCQADPSKMGSAFGYPYLDRPIINESPILPPPEGINGLLKSPPHPESTRPLPPNPPAEMIISTTHYLLHDKVTGISFPAVLGITSAGTYFQLIENPWNPPFWVPFDNLRFGIF